MSELMLVLKIITETKAEADRLDDHLYPLHKGKLYKQNAIVGYKGDIYALYEIESLEQADALKAEIQRIKLKVKSMSLIEHERTPLPEVLPNDGFTYIDIPEDLK